MTHVWFQTDFPRSHHIIISSKRFTDCGLDGSMETVICIMTKLAMTTLNWQSCQIVLLLWILLQVSPETHQKYNWFDTALSLCSWSCLVMFVTLTHIYDEFLDPILCLELYKFLVTLCWCHNFLTLYCCIANNYFIDMYFIWLCYRYFWNIVE